MGRLARASGEGSVAQTKETLEYLSGVDIWSGLISVRCLRGPTLPQYRQGHRRGQADKLALALDECCRLRCCVKEFYAAFQTMKNEK